MTRIEFENSDGSWLSANCDFENAGPFEDHDEAVNRINGLREEEPMIEFRLVDC
jgi:hypothetical protein